MTSETPWTSETTGTSETPGTSDAPDAAAAVETHCATVFFSGDRAYKVKKPLDLGFADFSTPQLRRTACEHEVQLNRRFAPDVYLGVAEVLSPEGEPCESIVVMRRMPADRRLSALVISGDDVTGPLRALARRLAAHHATARRSPEIDRCGGAQALRARWVDNFVGLAPFRDTVLDGCLLDQITDRALRYVEGRAPLLAARVADGRIRDGHGDLLADDIFCLPDGVRALDCLEFDDALRSVDGLDDAACLAMDLERLGRPDLGRRFLDWFVEFSGAPRVASLEHHYLAYRAVVRAKVACLRWAQDPGAGKASADAARTLAGIAARHLWAGDPTVVVVGGTPGTGKSTVAGSVVDALGAVLVRSDRLRKEGSGLAPSAPAGAAWRSGLYTPEATRRTYRDVVARASQLLSHGESVVVDASWSAVADRQAIKAAAAAAHSPVVELRCTAPPELAASRISRRAGTGDPSDATAAIATRMRDTFAAWPTAVAIPTNEPVEQTAAHALSAIAAARDAAMVPSA
jgi:aminoglycoside phosphotransferase family enzyme/predicted kinase